MIVTENLANRSEAAGTARDESFRHAANLLADAFTRPEVDAAQEAYKRHISRFPADAAVEMAHGFGQTMAYLEQREAEAEALRLNQQEFAERERLLKSLRFRGDFLADFQARQRIVDGSETLEAWLMRFPGDRSARNLLESYRSDLEVLRLIAGELDKEDVASSDVFLAIAPK